MTKEQIAKEIYRLEKPKDSEEKFVRIMCNRHSKDVLTMILESVMKEEQDNGKRILLEQHS